MWRRKNWNRLNEMLDEGIRGEFTESRYDETELSRVEAKWKHFLEASVISKKNLESERESMKSMISDIAHQTRTPIANIRLYGELLEERLKDPEEAEMIRQIRAQTEKLDFLLQALTKMSRLESGILGMMPAEGTVSELLDAAVSEIRPKASQKRMKVRVICPNPFPLLFDEKWTAEALYNILDNAVKYSPPASEITLSARAYEMYGAVSVKDCGIGISEEEIPKIFQRFYRSEKVREEEGVGIGLYLAREILRKQDGYIKVTSSPGEGSTFTMYLPRL